MKTRIVWTKIWEDEWFATLSDPAQKLFIYLLTNSRANMCGCYQLSDRVIIFDTRIADLETAKKELNPKAKFKSGWVYLPNAKYYGGYSGKKNEVTIKKEEAQIDKDIKLSLFTTQQDRVSIGYPQVETTTDTTINLNLNNKYKSKSEKEINKEKENICGPSTLADVRKSLEARGVLKIKGGTNA